MAAKLGSFRYNFAEKRERSLSMNKGYSGLCFVPIQNDEENPYGSSRCCCFRSISDGLISKTIQDVSSRAWQMGMSDSRKGSSSRLRCPIPERIFCRLRVEFGGKGRPGEEIL